MLKTKDRAALREPRTGQWQAPSRLRASAKLLAGTMAFCLLVSCDGNSSKLAKENEELRAQLAAVKGGAASTGGVAHQAGESSSTLYYANGAVAWSGTRGGTVYHSNGQVAWSGTRGGTVYHANGRVAYSGTRGGTVYYDNGQVAWSGTAGATAYHSNGAVMTSTAYGVTVPLWDDAMLIVDGDGARLNVLGTSFPVN